MILTKPISAEPDNRQNGFAGALLRRKYPRAAQAIAECNSLYQSDLKAVQALEEEGKALIIAPDDISKLKTLSSDLNALKELYQKGYDDASAIAAFLA